MCFIKLILFSGWSPRAALCCWQPNRAVASREGRLQGAGWGQLLHRAAWSWQGLFSVPPLASPISWSLPLFLFLSSPPPFLLPLPFFPPLCFYLSWERRTYFFLSFSWSNGICDEHMWALKTGIDFLMWCAPLEPFLVHVLEEKTYMGMSHNFLVGDSFVWDTIAWG